MRGTVGRASAVFVLLLLLAFLVGLTPVEAAVRCTNKYIGTAKITDGTTTQERWIKGATFYVYEGATKKKMAIYKKQQKTCTYGHYEKQYRERVYCPNTKKCEYTGNTIKIPYGRWSKCTGWVTVGYEVRQIWPAG
ncbi:hypothetical protein [Methanothrix sp.]|uniref:hypothetical protein n=1 Tax=Methanothrix sp. TaxID=90426 RepID=UPI0034E25C60